MGDEAKIERMIEMISDLNLRNDKLESEAMMTHIELTDMRLKIDELTQTLATFMDMMSQISASAITTSTPSNAVAMAGGGGSSAHADTSATVVKTVVKKPCSFFAQGKCTKGDACSFAHVSIKKPCSFFAQGKCTKGEACPFTH
jgi:hypothetical protein